MEIEKFLEKATNTSPDEINFIAISNISEEKLSSLLDLGLEGLPSPSVQIKPFPNTQNELSNLLGTNSLYDFGEISFVFNQPNLFGDHNTIPKNDATHNIYAGDGYTLRFPDVVHSQHIKERNVLKNELLEIFKKDICVYDDNFDIYLTKKNKEHVLEKAKDSFVFKLLYLQENGLLEEFKPKYKKVYKVDVDSITKLEKDIMTGFDLSKAQENPNTYLCDKIQKLCEGRSDVVKKMYEKRFSDSNGNISSLSFYEYYKNEIIAINQGQKPTLKVDKEKTYNALNKLLNKAQKNNGGYDFISFVEDKMDSIYHSPKIKETGKDVTLDNIVQYMKRNRGLGSEQTLGFGMLNREVAKTIRKIRCYDDLIDNLDVLTDEDRKDKCYIDMHSKLISFFDGNISREKYDELFNELIPKIITTTGLVSNIEKLKIALEDINIKNVSNDVISEFSEFISEQRNKKQFYYEAKPNKGFLFKHAHWEKDRNLHGVVVPNNLSKKLMDFLENKTDLKIIQYNPNNKLSRLKALYRFKSSFIKKPKKEKKYKHSKHI